MSSEEPAQTQQNEETEDENFTLLFSKEISVVNKDNQNEVETENEEEEEKGVDSDLIIEVYIQQTEDNLEAVKMRFLSKDDLRFLFEKVYRPEDFDEIKKEQELEFDFGDFPNVLEEILGFVTAHSENENYKAIWNTEGNQGILIIEEDLDLCVTEIFNFRLDQCSVERIKRVSQDRYNELNHKYQELMTQYKDMVKRIKRQDPKILATFRPVEGTSI